MLEAGADFQVAETWVAGQPVARQGRCLSATVPFPAPAGGELTRPTINAAALTFAVPDGPHQVNVLRANTRNTFTVLEPQPVAFEQGWPQDEDADDVVNTVAVFTRQGSGPPGLGLLRGFGLRAGAFASTLAHDSHNLLVVGRSRTDMLAAAHLLQRRGAAWPTFTVRNGCISPWRWRR